MKKSNYKRVIFGIAFILVVSIVFSISGKGISTNGSVQNQENTLKISEVENSTISTLEATNEIIDNSTFPLAIESNQAFGNESVELLDSQYMESPTVYPILDQIWSPDGTKLAYIKSPGGRTWDCELWVADKDPTSAQLINHQMIYSRAEYNGLLDWRDDWILFKIRYEDGTPSSYYGRDELWKIRSDGSYLTQVTFTFTNGIRYSDIWRPNMGSASWGMFIPGTSLIYFRAHNGNGWWRAFVCNDDGTDNWQHISYPDYAFRIAMSPTGGKLLWGHATYWNNPTTLRASNVDGSGRTTVKTFSKSTSSFVLADGNTVVWNDINNIYAINIDGTNERTIIADEYYNRGLNYIPIDGQELIMGSDRDDGNHHLFSIRTDGNNIVQLTDGPYIDEHPYYSPNGRCLSYLRRPESSSPPYPYELIIKCMLLKIGINSPISDAIFGKSAPDFDLSIIGENIDSTWYSLDGGLTKILFSGLAGTIDQSEWDKIGNGPVTIEFYVNDTNGNINQAEVTVIKEFLDVKYSRHITLNPTTPEDDYQIKIQLNPSNFDYSKTKFDGSDIRFFDLNQIPLSYWIENWDNSGSSIIWVKIPNAGTSVISMVYGDPSANSLSNGESTFILFDDFEGSTLDLTKWYTDVDVPGASEIAEAQVSVSSSIAETYLRLNPDDWGGQYTPQMRWESSAFGWHDYWATGGGYGDKTPNGFAFFNTMTRTETSTSIETYTNSESSEWTWSLSEIQWVKSSSVKFYQNEVMVAEHTNAASFPTAGTLPIKFLVHGGSYPAGKHYAMSLVSINKYNEIGYALRTMNRHEWNGGDPNDLSLTMQTDWILIHKCHEYNPIANIGPEIPTSGAPAIIINTPIQNAVFGINSPNFDLSIICENLDSTWYSLDGGLTNIFFSGITGTIEQLEWDKVDFGTVTIAFYANNTVGEIGQADVNVVKWIPGIQYKREITLNPTTPENDYQIKILLDSTNFDYSKTKIDGSDVRFFDQNQLLLSYWVETWDTSGTSIIWVKVPNAGTSVISMVYGDPSANSLSDGESTFILFDDFEGSTLDSTKWYTDVDVPGAYEIAEARVSVSNSIAETYLRLNPDDWGGQYTPQMRWESSAFGWHDYWATGGGYGDKTPNGFAFFNTITRTESSTSIEAYTNSESSEWTWSLSEIQWVKSSSVKFYQNEVMVAEHTNAASFPTAGTLPIKFMVHGGSYPAGRHYAMSLVSINKYNEIGYALRTMNRHEWNGGSPNDLSLTMQTDWVLIHKCHEFDPIISIGPEIPMSPVPEITINSPNPNDVFGFTPPTFDVTITSDNLDSTWYSLDGGLTKIFFSGATGTIDQLEWDKIGHGIATISFYAKDTYGNTGQAELSIIKDILAPIITINFPSENQIFGVDAPTFDLTIIEDHLDSTWYSLDGGLTKIFFNGLTGSIDPLEWRLIGDGTIQIKFYANDTLGNEDYTEITIIKSFVSDLFVCLSQIQELMTGEMTIEASNYLGQAENKIMLAIEKVNMDLRAPSIYLLMDVVHFLLDAEGEGIEITEIINLIMRNTDGVVYYKIYEAEYIILGESNNHLNRAWVYYNQAVEHWDNGEYENALSDYAKAYEKVNDALKP